MLPPNTSTNFRQGVYKPINRNKYKGSKDPVYRSGWELKFFKFCDGNPNVLEWTSEGIIIPYVSPVDNKVHRYFVDNMVYIKEGEVKKRYLIEIKPSKQTVPPTESKRKKKSTMIYEQVTYAQNKAKWAAAMDYAKKHNMEFKIITEKELGISYKR